MIQVQNLSFVYPPPIMGGEQVLALNDISLNVGKGHSLAVTGPNNAGLTTLCLAVAGVAPRLTGGTLSGYITIKGQDVQGVPPGALADQIGLVLQDPAGQLFNPSVEEEIAWGLENLGLPREQMPARIDWALEIVGLDDVPRAQLPQTLSGGQQKRLALAAALALKPQILILDEPSGGLSPRGKQEMIAVLKSLCHEHALTLLFTEKDPDVIIALADEMLLLDHGSIQCSGMPSEVYSTLKDTGVIIPPASRFAQAVNAGTSFNLTCLTPQEAYEQVKPYALNNAHQQHIPERSSKEKESAVRMDKVSFSYPDGHTVLEQLSLTIPTGQFVAMIGDNGAGKTTLAHHLIGLLHPTTGQVVIMGSDTRHLRIGELARHVGLAFQNPERQIFNPTIWEEVAFGPRNLGLGVDEITRKMLDQFGLMGWRDYPPAALSFSTRRLIALASVAALQTPIIVLDEPTVGLDANGQHRVMQWLHDRHQQGATIILITHDVELAAHAERVLLLANGQILLDGSPYEVFSQGDILNTTGLKSPFAIQLAALMNYPALAADPIPEGAARIWLERQK